MVTVKRLDAEEVRSSLDELGGILLDCVEGGASVNFMLPYTLADGCRFFENLVPSIAAGERILLAAYLDGRMVGTVQAVLKMPPNQPHRGEIAKMLVHRLARRQGIAAMLMQAIEAEAHGAGKTLLVLDTVTGQPAERLYERLGWQRVGVVPGFALFPDGRPCDTTYFWKSI